MWLLYLVVLSGFASARESRLMRRSSSRMLGMLCVIATTCATVFAAAAPAFAVPAHKPHATVTGDQIAKRANADLQSASSYRIYSSTTIDGLTIFRLVDEHRAGMPVH